MRVSLLSEPRRVAASFDGDGGGGRDWHAIATATSRGIGGFAAGGIEDVGVAVEGGAG
jgi:hypothetical protein